MAATESPSRQELFLQLQNAIALRSAQDQVLWTILGFFGATNAVLITAIFSSGDLPKTYIIPAFVIPTGMALCFAWNTIQARALGHIKRHEALMARLETALALPHAIATSSKLNRELYEEFLEGGRPARSIMPLFGWLALLMWFLLGCVCLHHYQQVR
jgi:hypothetical protein